MLQMISKLSGILQGDNPKYLGFILSVATDSENPLFSSFWNDFREKFPHNTLAPREAFMLFQNLRTTLVERDK